MSAKITKGRFIHLGLMVWEDAKKEKKEKEKEKMRASLKLGPSFLIHAKTSKGKNSTIGKL